MVIFLVILGGVLIFSLTWLYDYTTKTPREQWKIKDAIIPIISVILGVIGFIFLFVIHPIIGLLLLIPIIIISLVKKLFK